MKINKFWLTVIMGVLALSLTACGGRYVKAQKELTVLPPVRAEDQAVDVWEIPMHPYLLLSEGLGVPHDIQFENPDGKKKAGKLIAYKAVDEGEVVLLAFTKPGEIELSQKAVVSSRSGQNFYTLDGAEHYTKDGYRGPKFDWEKIKPLKDYSFTKRENVKPGTNEYAHFTELMAGVREQMEKDALRFPSKFERILAKIGKITTEDIVIGATFPQVYGLVGLRLFAAINVLAESADLSLPFYDTALVNRLDLAMALAPFQENNKAIKQALEDWRTHFGQVEAENLAEQIRYQQQMKLYEKLVAEHKACIRDPSRDRSQLSKLLDQYEKSLAHKTK